MEEAMVEEPTKNPNVPPKTNMEEQKDYEDHDNGDNHENEDGQPTIVFSLQNNWRFC
jgi:hypothetical protein